MVASLDQGVCAPTEYLPVGWLVLERKGVCVTLHKLRLVSCTGSQWCGCDKCTTVRG